MLIRSQFCDIRRHANIYFNKKISVSLSNIVVVRENAGQGSCFVEQQNTREQTRFDRFFYATKKNKLVDSSRRVHEKIIAWVLFRTYTDSTVDAPVPRCPGTDPGIYLEGTAFARRPSECDDPLLSLWLWFRSTRRFISALLAVQSAVTSIRPKVTCNL